MTVKKRNLICVLPMAFLFTFSLLAAAQGGNKTIRVSRTDTAPSIDGEIDDPCWDAIEPVSDFYQFDPDNGAKASEETYVRAAYDGKNIYFAFLMKDSQPEKIWAELTPRNRFRRNDSITVVLDTYNDKRTSIRFTVNPRGVQKNSVETIWRSGAKQRTDGWSAEIAIPFKSLRFSTLDNQTWGVNFERYIPRLNEQNTWTAVKRGKPRLQQMGTLVGLEEIKPSGNIEFFPYFGVRSSRWDDEEDKKTAVGLDFKYGILPNLTLDMTASPDFSEVESDPFIYQLSPYENYLRENRLFFTEGSHYFGGGRGRWRQTQFTLFYSRRIQSPKIAAKVTGKSNGFSYGLLGALNKEEDTGDYVYSVLRVKKDILKNSQIGFYYAGMDQKGDYNRNVALDYSFNFKDYYYIRGQSAFSFNKDTPNKGIGMHVFQFEREPDEGLQLELYYMRVEENVDVRTGYIGQTDIQRSQVNAGYAWRHNGGRVKRTDANISVQMQHDSGGTPTVRTVELWGGVRFKSQLFMYGGFDLGKSKYQVYDDQDNLFWAKDFLDTYGGFYGINWYRGGFLKGLSLRGSMRRKGIYNDEFTAVEPGKETQLRASVTLRPRSSLEFSVGGEWTRQTLDRSGEAVFDGITYNTYLHLQVTRRLFVSSSLLGETRDDQYSLDLLAGYYFGAGNIIQLSYKRSSRMEDLQKENGYSITLKVSYLLRV